MTPPNPLALQAAQPAPMVPNYGVPIVPMVGNTRSTTTSSPELSRSEADEFKRRNKQILDEREEQRRKEHDAALIQQLHGEKQAADMRAAHAKFAEARILGEEEGKRDFEAAKSAYAAEKAKRESMKPTEFWGSRTSEQKIWAGVAASLGAIGAGLRAFSGERGVDPTSGVMGIFEKQIAAHNERETARLKHQDDIVTRAHGGIGESEDRAEKRNRTALANEAAAWNRILRTFEVEANAAGLSKEALAANRDYIAAQEKAMAADVRFAQYAHARSTSTQTRTEAQQIVPGSALPGKDGGAKPPTEKEKAAAIDADWKEAALKRAQELDPSGRGFARAQKAIADYQKMEARKETWLGKGVNAVGQAFDQLPVSPSQHKLLRGDSREAQAAREYFNIMNTLGIEQAHVNDPVGAIGKDSGSEGMEHQAVTSKTLAEVTAEMQRMIDRQRRMAGAAAPQPITPPPVGGPPMPETKQAAASTDRAAAYRHLVGQKDPLTGKKIVDVEMGPNGRPVITTED